MASYPQVRQLFSVSDFLALSEVNFSLDNLGTLMNTINISIAVNCLTATHSVTGKSSILLLDICSN